MLVSWPGMKEARFDKVARGNLIRNSENYDSIVNIAWLDSIFVLL